MKLISIITVALSMMATFGLTGCEKKSDEANLERLATKRTHLSDICLNAYEAYLDTLALYPAKYTNSDEVDSEKLIVKDRFLSYSDKACTQAKQKYETEAEKIALKKVKAPSI